MKRPEKQYTDELRLRFGYWATWLPGVPLVLGDIGFVNGNLFTRVAHLLDFKISFETREDHSADDLDYSSKGAVSITTKIAGAVSPEGSSLSQVDAGFIVEFKNENSILFRAKQIKTNLIKNTIGIGQIILDLYRSGKWDERWVVITELIEAESATIFISNSSDAKIELRATANFDAANLDIADSKFEFSSIFSKGMDIKIVAQTGLTPLFKVKGIKRKLFKPPGFEVKSSNLVLENSRHDEDIYFSDW